MFGRDPRLRRTLTRIDTRIRYVIASLVPGFALLALPGILSSEGPGDGWPRIIAFAVLLTTIPAGLLVANTVEGFSWAYAPNRNLRGTFLFSAYADVGVAVVLLTFSDRTAALVGCVLLALVSTYLAYFGLRWMVLIHIAFTSSVIVLLAVLALEQGRHDTLSVIFRAGVILTAVNGTVWVTTVTSEAFHRMLSRQMDRAQTDPLTDVLNLRGLHVSAGELAENSRGALGFMLIDVDNFKAVNDVHGHVVGDTVLVLAARRLRAHFGSRAVIARRGGEEFVVVMPGTIEDITREAEHVKTLLSNPDDAVHVTVSIGVSVVEPSPLSPTFALVTHGMHTSDMAMYVAKSAGRDRVAIHHDSNDAPGAR